jgi:DNA replication licensing factor MCM3
LLHGNTRSRKEHILSSKFMRKFIHIARLMKPKLTQDASDAIAEEYARLRNHDAVDSDVARVRSTARQTIQDCQTSPVDFQPY